METDTEQKRFLENFYKYLSNKKIITPEWRDYHSRKEIILRFSKNLAKNKQTENDFKCAKSFLYDLPKCDKKCDSCFYVDSSQQPTSKNI